MLDALLRKLPIFRGKQRLARLLFRKNIANDKNFWVKGKRDCEYFLPNLIENISFEIFINGAFEEETSNFFAELLPKNGVFLDLGANIGTVSIPLASRRHDIKIVCVEASPKVFIYLTKNIERNNANSIIAINKALFYTDNEELNFYSPDDQFGKGSFSPVFTDKLEKVKTIKVDSLLKSQGISKVDMIKIDVEGYEYHVFKGATDLLSSEKAPDILFEFADWAEEIAGVGIGAAQQILFDMGYHIYYFNANLKEMKALKEPVKNGFFMLFASKNKQSLQ